MACRLPQWHAAPVLSSSQIKITGIPTSATSCFYCAYWSHFAHTFHPAVPASSFKCATSLSNVIQVVAKFLSSSQLLLRYFGNTTMHNILGFTKLTSLSLQFRTILGHFKHIFRFVLSCTGHMLGQIKNKIHVQGRHICRNSSEQSEIRIIRYDFVCWTKVFLFIASGILT